MRKKDIVRKCIDRDIWEMFKSTYKINSDTPTSSKQEKLLKSIAEYVYENFAIKIPSAKLKLIFDNNGEQDDSDERK